MTDGAEHEEGETLAPRAPHWARFGAALALGLLSVPGTFVHADRREGNDVMVTLRDITDTAPGTVSGPLRLENLSKLVLGTYLFGGHSALMLGEDGDKTLVSDLGHFLPLAGDHRTGPVRVQLVGERFAVASEWQPLFDMESATVDHATGRSWIGFEQVHVITRFGPTGMAEKSVRRPEFADWSANAGLEAIQRLPDGRFIALREEDGEGWLFDGDPVEGARAMRFTVKGLSGYEPVDMGLLPDGRVIVLLRRLALAFPPFSSALAVGDPRLIAEGQDWQLEIVGDLDALLPRENYEGLAVDSSDPSAPVLWLISDNNRSALQRTLLARIALDMKALPQKR